VLPSLPPAAFARALTRPCRNFTIQKLQDAYDCDLDLGDTVSSIFEGETDASMRLIKVVPAFVGRDFSVPATSNLRPTREQKRARELQVEHANKRRRIERLNGDHDDHDDHDGDHDEDRACNHPVPSTESECTRQGSHGPDAAHSSRAATGTRTMRSQTGASVVVVRDAHTGLAEFSPGVKEESPELGLAPPTPVRNGIAKRQSARPRSETPPASVLEAEQQPQTELPAAEGGAEENMHGDAMRATPEAVPAVDVQPTAPPAHHSPPPAETKRNDVYDVPSSPEFMANKIKAKRTYGRSPRTATHVQKEVDLLNHSRRPSNLTPKSDLTSAFLQDVQSPATALNSSTPAKRLDPEIQERLDKLNQLRLRRRSKFEIRENESPSKPMVEEAPPKKDDAENTIVISSGETSSQSSNKDPEDSQPWANSSTTGAARAVPAEAVDYESKPEALSSVEDLEDAQVRVISPTADLSEEARADELEEAVQEAPEEMPDEVIEEAIEPDSETEAPARFLSRSPSPNGSASEAESERTSNAASKAASPVPVSEQEATESSSSESEESSTNDEDVEMLDITTAPAPNGLTSTAPNVFPSSPPNVNVAPASTLMVPETSQPSLSQLNPLVRRTPIPLPSNLSQTPRSSQVASTQATVGRPHARHTGFRTLREQLADAKTPPTANQKKAYDPRLTGLSKLASRGKGTPSLGVGLENDDSSDEESSSSSSSDSD
jgi:hypothetical protein